MKKIDRVIEHFRNLREMMAVGAGGFTASGDPEKTAGFDPVMGKPQKRYLKGGKGSRKKWLDYLRNK